MANGDGRGGGMPAAMVLAGGLGTRLAGVVADRPKPLATVGGEPFVLRVLDQLATAGVPRTVLCTGHLGDRFERELGREHEGMELVFSREPAPLGTAGALRHALPRVLGEDVLVLNGDSFCAVDLADFVDAARRAAAPALVATRVADGGRYGALEFVDETCEAPTAGLRRVARFREKDGVAAPAVINAGIYLLPRAALAALPAGAARSLERDVLPGLVGDGLFALPTDAPFLDIGTPESYAAAEAFFAALPQQRERAAGQRRAGLLVLDRDGTLIEERHYLADPHGVALLPGVVDGLRSFQRAGYELAVVTNQSGIGRGLFDEATLAAIHGELLRQLAAEGVRVRGVWHCPHVPDDGCDCRKPEPGLLQQVLDATGFAPAQCLVVGDKECDVQLGHRLGARTVLVRTGYGRATEAAATCRPDLVVDGLDELARREVLA